jgi:hypothetical protein
MNAEPATHRTLNPDEDLRDLQEERKHLETLFADRINFYLVFAAGVLVFLVDKDHPTPIVKWALWIVSIVSVLMLLALIRTFVLVMMVLRNLVRRHPHVAYSKLCKKLKWWRLIIPNANFLLLLLPAALAVLFIHSCATLKDDRVATDLTPVIRANRIEIVDSAGVPRMRLGAPLPDATLDGTPQQRRSPASGIQLNDAKGNEVGGLVMLDDGTLTFCFDTPTAEADCMYVMPSGERGFWVGDNKGKDRAQMILKQNKTRLEVRDENGKVVWAAP